ncbi:MAG: lysylphosphatidylglycerol synthase transmembrane domain-containing protein [Candidatus Bipolaricaulis sp.]|nr:lysylphosphatidylglycerol synthase transmembrane domain-containing protein [Candidatus Bipolaricaulis sp.]
MKRPLRSTLQFAGSVVVGLGGVSAVLYFVGWRGTLEQMRALGVMGVLSVLGMVVLPMLAWILCWSVILHAHGIRIPLFRRVGAQLSGYSMTYLTPTMYFGGEPVRAFLVADKERAPMTRVFATIIVERFLRGLSMVGFILIGSFYAIVSPALPMEEKRLLIASLAFVTFWIVVGFVNFAGNLKWISRIIRFLGRRIPRWQDPLGRAANKVSETEDEVGTAFTKHWRATLLALAIQGVATVCAFLRPQVFFHFSAGHGLTLSQISLLFTLNVLLSFFLWITPGGLGTSEAGLIGIFHLVAPQVTSEGVVAYSLIFKFAEWLLVAAGVGYMLQRGVGFLGRKRESPPAPPP